MRTPTCPAPAEGPTGRFPYPWRVPGAASVALIALLAGGSTARADLAFAPPSFLPGDALIGAPAGMQVEVDVARGGDVFLAVWSDGRTTPNDFYPFATEGSGTDVWGALLDDAGNPIGAGPFLIDARFGDQVEPRVAWNGEAWLVVWKQEIAALPTYEELRATRVAPDGTVLDATSIPVHSGQSFYNDAVVEGGGGEWVVLFQVNGPTDGLRAVRIAGDGTVANPGGLSVVDTLFLLDFDLAFAGDEWMIVWGGTFDPPRARRYTPDLQPIGTSVLPFADRVATDGTDFLVVWASGPPPGATVKGVLVGHGGLVGSPFTLFTGGNQAGTCCADATWDGTYYWISWGGPRLARVTSSGQVLDPGGFAVAPAAQHFSAPRFEGVPTGGVRLVYNDGSNGAAFPKDVYTGRVSPDRVLSDETLVSRGAPAQLESDFAEGDGIHLIVFASRVSDGGRILAHRLDDTGIALDPEPIEVATGPIPGEGVPTLGAPAAAWNGSVFMITWSDGLEIHHRRLLPDGTFLDATPKVVMDGRDPDVAAVGQVFLVVGLDFLLDNPEWQATHSMRVDGATGANLDGQPNALGGFAIFARYPHVVSWNDRWLAVWQRNLSHDEPAAGTTAAFVHADGTTPGLIEVPLGWRPDVAVSDDRALFVAVTNTVASATTDLRAQLMAADGSFVGSTFPISTAADKQLRPAVTWNGTEFVVAWEDKRNAAIYFDERTDVYGCRVDATGNVLDPVGVPLAVEPEPELQPAFASIGGTTLLAVSAFRPDSELAAYRVAIRTSGNASTGVPDAIGISALRLLGARPNPARSATTIRFQGAPGQPYSVRIFDAGGRLLRTLAENRRFPAGGAPVDQPWDGRDEQGRAVGSGVFFYRLETPTQAAAGKLVLLQ